MKASLILILLFSFFDGFAQQAVDFFYDSAGNRIQRKVAAIPLMADTSTDEITAETVQHLLQDLHNMNSIRTDREVNVYPNPTSDNLVVEVTDQFINEEIYLYSVSGQLVLRQKLANVQTVVDVSALPEGEYLMALKSDETSFTWKIVKSK